MVTKLGPGVWWLSLGRLPLLSQNGYLVDDGGDLTLVDAGLPCDVRRLRAAVRDAGFAVSDVDRVLVTHYDLDHVGGLGRLRPDLDAPVYIGEADARLALGETSPPWLHHKGAFHRVARRVCSLPASLPVERVADGDTVGGFVAHHTPGHNPGHVVYFHERLRAALLGDLVWEQGGRLTAPPWWDSYDTTALRASIRSLAARLPAFDVACMGHGRPLVRGGAAALDALAETLR